MSRKISQHLPCDGDLGYLEDSIAAVPYHLRADVDQFFLQARQRPILDWLRRRQRAQEIADYSAGAQLFLAAPCLLLRATRK